MSEKSTAFEYRNVNDLIPYARNARTHSPEQVQKLAGSIKEFGFINPIIISEDGGVLAGHGRILAAQKLGLKQVPCVVESHLTEAQRRAYILADNRLALDAGWDEEMLKIELNELQGMDFDLDLIGFNDEELKQFMEDFPVNDLGDDGSGDEEVDVDENEEAVTQPGDVWLMGDHRLICGDCTSADVVSKLFGEDKPVLMVTDPPYGVNYDPTTQLRTHSEGREGKVYNDDRADWYEAYALFPGNVAYIWHASSHSDTVMTDIKKCGFSISSMIIWNKSQFAMGLADYHWKHEPCVYATKGNHNWKGGRSQCTVWDIPTIRVLKGEEGEWGHGTQKPIECMKRPIENNSDIGDYVYDPFLGSGTTIIAAEKSKRKCLGCEISPNYCDAIVRRWESVTGGRAILQGDGAYFDDLANDDEVGEV